MLGLFSKAKDNINSWSIWCLVELVFKGGDENKGELKEMSRFEIETRK